MYYPARSKIKYAKPDPTKMCGDGRIEALERGPASPHLRAAHVRFVNGARTKWHYHTGEQILVATKGKGFVEFQGIRKIKLHPGDRVFVPAGVWHRHGAVKKKKLVHLAITKGKSVWEPDDPCDMEFETKRLPEKADYLAPDGSEIRLLPTMNGGGLAHCTLPPGGVSKPVYHRTVEEIWYCIKGDGEVWRKQGH
jgi:quercetin dioxygenase-like cupin family protein